MSRGQIGTNGGLIQVDEHPVQMSATREHIGKGDGVADLEAVRIELTPEHG